MDGLARERLGRLNPELLADLLKLTPEQRRQMVQQLAAKNTSDGTVPVEVAMRAAQIAKASGESLGPAWSEVLQPSHEGFLAALEFLDRAVEPVLPALLR